MPFLTVDMIACHTNLSSNTPLHADKRTPFEKNTLRYLSPTVNTFSYLQKRLLYSTERFHQRMTHGEVTAARRLRE